jgi:uncharacterized membrane protein YfcA
MLNSWILAYSVIAVLIAGFVRGYGGFGFSMIAVVSLTLVLPPAEVVPVILLLEVAASAWLLPGVWRQVHWRSLGWLSLGVVLGTPAGVYLLANVPARPMRAAIAVVVLALAMVLIKGLSFQRIPGPRAAAFTGVVSGVLNGGAAVGGPPAILFYFSSPGGVALGRASLIAFFLGTDILAGIVSATQGLIHGRTFHLFALFLPPLIVGLVFGGRSFKKTDEGLFRRRVLLLLIILSAASLTRAIWD